MEPTRVYLYGGKVAHLLAADRSPNSYASALCGVGPMWSDHWRGTGSQDEEDRAANLRTCKRCAERLNRR